MAPPNQPPPQPDPSHPPRRETTPNPVPLVGLGNDQVNEFIRFKVFYIDFIQLLIFIPFSPTLSNCRLLYSFRIISYTYRRGILYIHKIWKLSMMLFLDY